MNIVLQDIIPPVAAASERFEKILLMNGEVFYPHDLPQNEYHEFVLHALKEKNIHASSWNIISNTEHKNNSAHKKIILEHVTRSRNILCTTSDALSVLHRSSFTLNSDSEIIPITSHMRASLMKKIRELAAEGNVVSGVAIKKIESKLQHKKDDHNGIFIALILHKISLLPNAGTTIDGTKKSNHSIKIFSKELLPTCKWFARKIGIHASDDFCITSDVLQSMSDVELAEHINYVTIFAEMSPLDLKRISRLLTLQGHEIIR